MLHCVCASGVLKGLVLQALEKLQVPVGGTSTEALVHALEKREGKVDVASIDLEQELKDLKGLSLFSLFPSSVWPAANPVMWFAHCAVVFWFRYLAFLQVREMKTRIREIEKREGKAAGGAPFFKVDLKK
jgi:hypothetical protein